jgi:hypothetical protein
MAGPTLLTAGAALLAGLGRVCVTLDAIVMVNRLDFLGIRVFLALELGRDLVFGHRVAGFALSFERLGMFVMLKPDYRILKTAEFFERVDGDKISAQLLRSDRFLLSPKSVQTESSHSYAHAQDSDPSQHWSSLLHVKIPLLKSIPENSGNPPRPEASPPSTMPRSGKNKTRSDLLAKKSKKIERKQTKLV